MAKYLAESAGTITEVQPITTSAGAGDAAKIAQLDASGRFDTTVMPVGIGPEVTTIQASEAIAAGAWVNIHNSAGARVRNANATTSGQPCHGFVLAAIASAASGSVYTEGVNTGVTGLVVGADVFLGTTAGSGTSTAPQAAGNLMQYLGVATSATSVAFSPVRGVVKV